MNQEECLASASPLYWSVQYRNCKLLQMLIVAGKAVVVLLRCVVYLKRKENDGKVPLQKSFRPSKSPVAYPSLDPPPTQSVCSR